MNVMKFYRFREGQIEIAQIRVTQSRAELMHPPRHRRPTVAEAKRFMAKNGWYRRARK